MQYPTQNAHLGHNRNKKSRKLQRCQKNEQRQLIVNFKTPDIQSSTMSANNGKCGKREKYKPSKKTENSEIDNMSNNTNFDVPENLTLIDAYYAIELTHSNGEIYYCCYRKAGSVDFFGQMQGRLVEYKCILDERSFKSKSDEEFLHIDWELHAIKYFKDGVLNGKVFNFVDKKIHKEMTFKDGLKHGRFIDWDITNKNKILKCKTFDMGCCD